MQAALPGLRMAGRRAAGGGGPFNPADYGTLRVDINPELQPEGGGASITSLVNQAGAPNFASSISPATRELAVINGKAVARFDGTTDGYVSVAAVTFGTPGVSVFFVGTITASAFVKTIAELSSDASTTANAWYLASLASEQIDLLEREATNSNFLTTATPTTPAFMVSGVIDRALGTDEPTVWIDGVTAGTRPSNNNHSANFSSALSLFVGARNGTSQFCPMDLARLLIYGNALDASNRTAVEAGLRAIYGTP